MAGIKYFEPGNTSIIDFNSSRSKIQLLLKEQQDNIGNKIKNALTIKQQQNLKDLDCNPNNTVFSH